MIGKKMQKVLSVFILSFFILNCSNEQQTIYETELSSTFDSYKKVKFEWYDAYTTKDSLIHILRRESSDIYTDSITTYDMDYTKVVRGTRKELDIIKKELDENTVRNDKLREKAKALNEEIKNLEKLKVFDTIMQNGIYTFKGDDKFYRVMVNFDSEGNYISHSIPLDPIEFDKLLNSEK